MRFEVPQFIEVEDKIVGPLTWRQFVYLAGAAGLLTILYLFTPFIIFAIVGTPFGALAGFLAFHKINNRPFSIFLESFINYARKTKLYLWRKETEQTVIGEQRPTPSLPSVHSGKQKLHALAEKLEFYSLEK